MALYGCVSSTHTSPAPASNDALFSTGVCVLFGVFSGYFLGRLACNLPCWQALKKSAQTSSLSPAVA
ncbi:MAG: hypothetical protein ABWY27_13875 [Telluria sp.]